MSLRDQGYNLQAMAMLNSAAAVQRTGTALERYKEMTTGKEKLLQELIEQRENAAKNRDRFAHEMAECDLAITRLTGELA
jgi:hypothetical protein